MEEDFELKNKLSTYTTLIKWVNMVIPNVSENFVLDAKIISLLLYHIDSIYFESIYSAFQINKGQYDGNDLNELLKLVISYYHEVLCLYFNADCIPKFDPSHVDDPIQLGKFLQLILGCAVNSENKQVYIGQILQMEQTCQEVMMNVIKELDLKEEQSPVPSPSSNAAFHLYRHPDQIGMLEREIEQIRLEKEEYELKYQELADKLAGVNQEKSTLLIENQKLFRIANSQEASSIGGLSADCLTLDGHRRNTSTVTVRDESSGGTETEVVIKELRKEVEALKEEIFRLENGRDDNAIQIDVLKRENLDLRKRNAEMVEVAQEGQKYKDEVDVLRHMAEKIPRYEASIEAYQKKLDTLSFKSQFDVEREGDNEASKNMSDKDEDRKKLVSLKQEMDALKTKQQQLLNSNEADKHMLEKAMAEKVELKERISKIESHNQNLVVENKGLKDENHHLNLCLFKDGPKDVVEETKVLTIDNATKESILKPSDIVDGNRRDNKVGSVEALQAELNKLKGEKDYMENRYFTYLEKAKKVITQLSQNDPQSSEILNTQLLKDELEEKENTIRDLRDRVEQLSTSQEIISMAWNNLALRMYKQNMSEGFSSSLWSQSSFLNRQRIISSKYKKN